jgi:hypothetical protein
MKRTHHQATRLAAKQSLNSMAHFPGRFIGERNSHNVPRSNIHVLDEIGDAKREDTRFAASRTSENKYRTGGRRHGRALGFIEAVNRSSHKAIAFSTKCKTLSHTGETHHFYKHRTLGEEL